MDVYLLVITSIRLMACDAEGCLICSVRSVWRRRFITTFSIHFWRFVPKHTHITQHRMAEWKQNGFCNSLGSNGHKTAEPTFSKNCLNYIFRLCFRFDVVAATGSVCFSTSISHISRYTDICWWFSRYIFCYCTCPIKLLEKSIRKSKI